MIQRIQSLFLAAIAAVSLVLFFVPFASVELDMVSMPVTILKHRGQYGAFIYLPFVLNALALLLSLISIFLFRNRALQMKLCVLLALLGALLGISLFVLMGTFPFSEGVQRYSFGIALPFVTVVLAILARRFIKKDEDLVRSADRIR